jgi:transcriptional regulator with XRE-family HTH domain
MSVIERFKKIRKNIGATQVELASMLDTNQQSITDIESGRKNISIDIMEKLHTKLSINLNWLICNKGIMKESNNSDSSIYEDKSNDESMLTKVISAQEKTINLYEKRIEELEERLKNVESKTIKQTTKVK